MGEKKEKKAPNTYVIIFFAMILVAVLSWIIPGGSYQVNEEGRFITGTYTAKDANPQGLWDVLIAPFIGMVGGEGVAGAIIISLNIMMFGSFLEIMDSSGAIKIFLKRIAMKYQNNINILIIILVTIMALLGTIEGCYEEAFVYLLMIMPFILALGLDTMVGAMIIIFGTQVGCLTSIINPFAVGIASDIAGISPGDGLLVRVLMFIIFVAITCFYICRYAKKVKEHPEKSTQYYRLEENKKLFPVSEDDHLEMTAKHKIILIIFASTFGLMMISLIPWTSLNEKFTIFEDITSFLAGLPFIGVVLGKDMVPFGQWYFNEVSMLLLVSSLVSGKILGYDINKIIDLIIKGAAGVVSTAFIVPFARGIQVIMDQGMITPTILHFGETTLSSLSPILFVIVSLVFYFIMGILISSTSGLAAATMSIMNSMALFAGVASPVIINVYMMGVGLANMIMPTSIAVMVCTHVANISYTDWVKVNFKFMILMFIACCIFLVFNVTVLS